MSKRVAIITDAVEHLGPDLARKLAQRNHNPVLGGASDELAGELRELGAEVEVVAEVKDGQDLILPDAVPSLIDRANKAFGGFNAAFIRPGAHVMGDMFSATADDMQAAFEGNMFLNYPGFLDSAGCRDPDVLERTLGNIPLARLGEPEEPAHIAAAMLDGESNYITGEFISVSGGWTST